MDANYTIIGWMVAWLVMAIGVFWLADWKGRSGLLFFFLAILLSPIIAFLIVVSLPPTQKALDARDLKRGDLKKCENCGALSRYHAHKCDPCGQLFPKRSS